MSQNNRNKKNKVKIEKAKAELDAEKRRKAKKNASGKNEKSKIKAEDKAAKAKAKEKAKRNKERIKNQNAIVKLAKKEQEALEEENIRARLKEIENRIASDDDTSAADDEADENEDVIELENPCIFCGEEEALPGKDYCADCSKALLKTRIPVKGLVFALALIIFSFFALINMGLLSAASLQIAKGDYFSYTKNYQVAFTVFDDVGDIILEINENFGEDSIFTKIVATGSGFDMRALECASDLYGPISALENFSDNVMTAPGKLSYTEHSLRYKKLQKYEDEFGATTEALQDVLSSLGSKDGLTIDELKAAIPKFEACLSNKNVNPVYVRYIIAVLSQSWCNATDEETLYFLDQVNEEAQKSNESYWWLYYKDYTNLLVQYGQYDKAMPLLREMMNRDASNYYSRVQICRILASQGKIDEAAKIVDDFQRVNVISNDSSSYYTDDAFALVVYMSRVLGNDLDAISIANESEYYYTYTPEVKRQRALILLSMGAYDEAFAWAYNSSVDANYISSYYAIENFDGNLIDETLYLAAYFAKDVIKEGDENYENLQSVLENFESYEYIPRFAKTIVESEDPEAALQKALTEGTRDLV